MQNFLSSILVTLMSSPTKPPSFVCGMSCGPPTSPFPFGLALPVLLLAPPALRASSAEVLFTSDEMEGMFWDNGCEVVGVLFTFPFGISDFAGADVGAALDC